VREPSCRICKKILIEDDRCLGLMYGKIKKEFDGFIGDDDDAPDVICMNCESIIYDAIDKAIKY
jgi:hypothetical protein